MKLETLIARELASPPPPGVAALAADIVRRHGASVVAILFYGSCRRTGDLSGLADLYVLYRSHRAFHGNTVAAFLNALLPPNVLHLPGAPGGGMAPAKVALMSTRQFRRRMRPGSLDTTVWTRFAQPASLIYAKNPAARRWTIKTLAEGIRTAVFWARRLSPPAATLADQWQALFSRTYRTELRAEPASQPAILYQANAPWFDAVAAAVQAEAASAPAATPRRHWLFRRLWGKPLNLLRLIKAAYTFENGADYLAWKIARHGGATLILTAWQRRHPILAAPLLLWRRRQRRR